MNTDHNCIDSHAKCTSLTFTEADECLSNPCVHGYCLDHFNAFTCTCDIGYTGHDCSYEFDECSSNPCVNGECTDAFAFYTCTCDEGYSGPECLTAISRAGSHHCCRSAHLLLNVITFAELVHRASLKRLISLPTVCKYYNSHFQ